ncbi:hypothetical protein R6Q59_030302 [Mikania micrantha]
MVASKFNQILSTLFFLCITLNFFVSVMGQECPYPCYPLPVGGSNGGGGGNNQPTTSFSPPFQTRNYPPASTIFSYNPPSPNYYGSEPPPPDSIVPWFPYYSKKPAHSINQPSSSGSRMARMRPTVVISSISCLLLLLLWHVF